MILLRDCDETLKAYVHIDHLTEWLTATFIILLFIIYYID